jgi:hypothetical protein
MRNTVIGLVLAGLLLAGCGQKDDERFTRKQVGWELYPYVLTDKQTGRQFYVANPGFGGEHPVPLDGQPGNVEK